MAKTSISIDPDDLKWLRARARKHHGGNLSAAIAEGTKILRQHDSLRRLLHEMGAPELTHEDRERIDREIDGAPARSRPKRSKRAA